MTALLEASPGASLGLASPPWQTQLQQLKQEFPPQLHHAPLKPLVVVRRRPRYHFTREMLEKLFDLPLSQAAAELQTCTATLKRACRRLNISGWPYRERMLARRRQQVLQKRQQLAQLPPDQLAFCLSGGVHPNHHFEDDTPKAASSITTHGIVNDFVSMSLVTSPTRIDTNAFTSFQSQNEQVHHQCQQQDLELEQENTLALFQSLQAFPCAQVEPRPLLPSFQDVFGAKKQ